MNNILLLLDWSNVPLILSPDRHSEHDKVPSVVLRISTIKKKESVNRCRKKVVLGYSEYKPINDENK